MTYGPNWDTFESGKMLNRWDVGTTGINQTCPRQTGTYIISLPLKKEQKKG